MAACSGSRIGWWAPRRTWNWWGCGRPALSSFWRRRRWRWSWWGQRSLPRWTGWSTAPGSWRPWPPAPGRKRPTTGRSIAGTRGSGSCCLWGFTQREAGGGERLIVCKCSATIPCILFETMNPRIYWTFRIGLQKRRPASLQPVCVETLGDIEAFTFFTHSVKLNESWIINNGTWPDWCLVMLEDSCRPTQEGSVEPRGEENMKNACENAFLISTATSYLRGE